MERERAVRRNTILLSVSLACVQAAFALFLVVAGPAAKDITGRAGAIGVLTALYFVSAALGALAIGRWMDRAGRRPGLLLSAALLAIGGIAGALAIAAGSFTGMILATVPFGVANGGANLTRGAVADMYPAQRRGKAVGTLLAAGTVGAVGGPLVVALLQRVAESSGRFDPQVLPWILVPASALGAAACIVAVRPDPRDLAFVDRTVPLVAVPARSPSQLLALPPFRLAVVAAAVGQMAMVGVMSVTPTALHDHGHGGGAISLIISAHITGMFALGPLIGAAMDRYGRRAGLFGGFVASCVGSALAATEASALVVGIGLFAIGIGWSATYLGATAVISDVTNARERGGALGFMDLLVSSTSALAGLTGGLLLDAAGYRVLGIAVAVVVAAVIPVVAARGAPSPQPAATPTRPEPDRG